MFIFDGEAYRAVWSAKGSSGKVQCLKCLNFIHDDDIVTTGPFFAGIAEHDTSKFVAATNATIWAKADMLKDKHAERIAGRCTQAEFGKLSTATGLTFNEFGLLWDKDLRKYVLPGDQITFDSMHNLYSNGLLQYEAGFLWSRLLELGVDFGDFRQFVRAPFKICSCLGEPKVLKNCVSQQREQHVKKNGTFVCNASEMLLLRPVLLHFLQTVVKNRFDIQKELDSFEALSDMCLAAFELKRTRKGATTYRAHAVCHLRLSHVAYGAENAKPKHHFSLHAEHECTFDCFAGERKTRL